MTPQTPRTTKEFDSPKLTGVGIRQRQIEPGLGNASLQIQPVLLCFAATGQFLSIVLGADAFHLSFA